MFVLAEMRNSVRIPPDKFDRNLSDAVHHHLEKLLVGKVIKDVGYCIALFDIIKMDKPFLFPGDGAAHIFCNFRIAVFKPFIEEVLVGKVAQCSADGVRVSLTFFDNIMIPPNCLQQPSRFDEEESLWIWEYETDEGKHDMFMDIGEEIRFRVVGNTFQETSPTDLKPESEDKNTEKKTVHPYIITVMSIFMTLLVLYRMYHSLRTP